MMSEIRGRSTAKAEPIQRNLPPLRFLVFPQAQQPAASISRCGPAACSITEVGYRCGIDDPSRFSRSFKQHFNRTPQGLSEKPR
ncbi:MAG: AraC family transcriptional regulator [Opitutales bacterium]